MMNKFRSPCFSFVGRVGVAALTFSCLTIPQNGAVASPLRTRTPTNTAIVSSSHRELQSNTTNTTNLEKINAILAEELPKINSDLRESLEDPFALDLEEAVPLGCNNLALTMEFSELKGLSTINLTSLIATSDSVDVEDVCVLGPKWLAKSDILVNFLGPLIAKDVRASVVGRCGGITYDQPLSVSLQATDVTFTGFVNMKGQLEGGTLPKGIDYANILNSLSLTASAFPVTIGLFPDKLSQYLPTAETQLQAAFRTQLVDDIEPLVRQKLEEIIPTTFISKVKAAASDLRGSLGFIADLVDPVLEAVEEAIGIDISDIIGGIFGGDDEDEEEDDEDEEDDDP